MFPNKGEDRDSGARFGCRKEKQQGWGGEAECFTRGWRSLLFGHRDDLARDPCYVTSCRAAVRRLRHVLHNLSPWTANPAGTRPDGSQLISGLAGGEPGEGKQESHDEEQKGEGDKPDVRSIFGQITQMYVTINACGD